MKKYILLILGSVICTHTLFAGYSVKQGNTWGRLGAGVGQGISDSVRQQQQLAILERERQIQLELLERQKQIQLEILRQQNQYR